MKVLFLLTSCIGFATIGMVFGDIGSLLGFIFGGFLVVLTELEGLKNNMDELREEVFSKNKVD